MQLIVVVDRDREPLVLEFSTSGVESVKVELDWLVGVYVVALPVALDLVKQLWKQYEVGEDSTLLMYHRGRSNAFQQSSLSSHNLSCGSCRFSLKIWLTVTP